ncbi:MAG TPA: GatB/YqeY domain-containing protein [Hyphomicrobiales bacterium]|nr:GatB/YqeY domain-containing protein [Rhodobiaceae bacterium]HXK53129.1 GatB/YqeY domain-containing protein [Hyphomicrobiales bacterium]
MREQITAALKQATLAQEKRRMSTLRLITAAIKDRDIAARGSGQDGVSDEEILQILAKMIKQRLESAQTYEEAGRLDLSSQEREEIEIISSFLPRQLSEAEMDDACRKVVQEAGAAGLKDMGKCMAALKERYPGQMDFGKASKLVKDILAG